MSNKWSEKYVTPMDIAEEAGVTHQTVLAWIHRGMFPGAVRVGGGYRIPKSEVNLYQRPVVPKVEPVIRKPKSRR